MRAIIGIGNPGSRYKFNRHNVGFQFLDYFAEKRSLKFEPSKFDYYHSEGKISENEFVLVKPTTFVNLSGSAVLKCIENYKLNFQDFLVIVDDINLSASEIRIRKSGGDGGHNGLNSIISHLNSKHFARLRIGIGNEFDKGAMPDYVLSDFDNDEVQKLKITFEKILNLVEVFIANGYDSMLKEYSKGKNAQKEI